MAYSAVYEELLKMKVAGDITVVLSQVSEKQRLNVID